MDVHLDAVLGLMGQGARVYRGTSLMKNRASLGPYRRTMSRAL